MPTMFSVVSSMWGWICVLVSELSFIEVLAMSTIKKSVPKLLSRTRTTAWFFIVKFGSRKTKAPRGISLVGVESIGLGKSVQKAVLLADPNTKGTNKLLFMRNSSIEVGSFKMSAKETKGTLWKMDSKWFGECVCLPDNRNCTLVSNNFASRSIFLGSGWACPASQFETEALEIPKTSPTCCNVSPLASLSARIRSLSMTNDINRQKAVTRQVPRVRECSIGSLRTVLAHKLW